MSDLNALARFLDTDPCDRGCGEAMELLHVYAELLRRGEDAARFHPSVAAHLRTYGPCEGDLEGLLLAIEDGSG
ncbi:hypothetical protein AB0K15_38355 [Amycolatopsis sp. NPDC049253]|uniref:hypothetical protein n=1 Tax=Amycolatopsis sp. NPDC049253 TaxID=3155274 RepID=UPI003423FD99